MRAEDLSAALFDKNLESGMFRADAQRRIPVPCLFEMGVELQPLFPGHRFRQAHGGHHREGEDYRRDRRIIHGTLVFSSQQVLACHTPFEGGHRGQLGPTGSAVARGEDRRIGGAHRVAHLDATA